MKHVRLAMLGFGNAGQGFAKMLCQKESEIIEKYDCKIIVTAIATHSKGTIVDSEGINLETALSDIDKIGKFGSDTRGLCNLTTMEVIEGAEYDILCELTPLNIFTGQPAIDHIKAAFMRKKHVVSANKGPIAWAFDELNEISKSKKVKFFYETTVMDGTPIFNLTQQTLRFCKVTEVSGILNSTTNYILEELALGKDYDQVIQAGKSQGFIEANPAMDIEGYDAAAKVTALLNVLMDAGITPDQVERKGIEDITVKDIEEAKKRGKVIKLLCKGSLIDGKVKATVGPVEVSEKDMLASIDSTTSVVSITTDLMGKISIIEHAPEIQQTAYGIFGDVIRVLEEIQPNDK